MSAQASETVEVRLESDSEWQQFNLLIDHSWVPSADNLPPFVPPSGLSLGWQWYLYTHIRDYCPLEVQDDVFPQPLTPLSSTPAPGSAASAYAASASVASAAPDSVDDSTLPQPPA